MQSRCVLSAKRQKVLETVHQVLYCDVAWNESEIDGQRFRRIIERSNLDGVVIEVDEAVAREFRQRVQGKLKGTVPLNKSLLFNRIPELLNSNPISRETLFSKLSDFSKKCINDNLLCLEKGKLITKEGELYKLANHSKKLLYKIIV